MDDLLIDSSYLFPIFGIGLEYRDFESIFTNLPSQYSVKYNPVSLIEAKWYILRLSKKKGSKEDLLQSYRRGLLSLERDRRIASTQLTNEKVEELSDSLLARFQIQDYFDRLIYSSAAHSESILLTEDNFLHEIFKRTEINDDDTPKPKRILKWKDLLTT